MKLTVAIPTFNRIPQLKKTLSRLLPQLDDACELVILDNASNDFVESEISELLNRFSGRFEARVIRHSANIGANANILRCMELAQGDWVWILGDDDLPTEDAKNKIFNEINVHQDAAMVVFKTAADGVGDLQVTGIQNLLRAMNFSDLVFISTSIIRRDLFMKYLGDGYEAISTCAPHAAIAFSVATCEACPFVFRAVGIINWEPSPTVAGWNFLRVSVRMLSLLEHARLNNEDRVLLAKAIDRTSFSWYQNLLIIVQICFAIKMKTHSKQDCMLYWRERFVRHAPLRRLGPLRYLLYLGYACFLFPSLMLTLARMYLRAMGRSDDLCKHALPAWNNRGL